MKIAQQRSYETIKAKAAADVRSYLEGLNVAWNLCRYEGRLLRTYENALSRELYQQSLRILDQSGDPDLKNWVKAVRVQFGFGSYLPGLKVLFDEIAQTPLPAGASPETGLLFFRVDLLSPQQWLPYFIHEVSHALDQELRLAAEVLARQKQAAARLAQRLRSDLPLQDADREAVKSLVLVGLHRGLFAETRAWLQTLCSREGLAGIGYDFEYLDLGSPLWEPGEYDCREDVPRVLSQLSPRFLNPTTGLLANPRIADWVMKIRLDVEAQYALDNDQSTVRSRLQAAAQQLEAYGNPDRL